LSETGYLAVISYSNHAITHLQRYSTYECHKFRAVIKIIFSKSQRR